MRLKAMWYEDDGKAETRLKFPKDNLEVVIAASVSVKIEGDVPADLAENLEHWRKEFEKRVMREMDFALFGICVGAVRATIEGKDETT